LVEIRLQFSQSAPGPTSVDSARDIVLVRSKIRNNSAITPKKGLNLYRLNSAKNTTTIRPVTHTAIHGVRLCLRLGVHALAIPVPSSLANANGPGDSSRERILLRHCGGIVPPLLSSNFIDNAKRHHTSSVQRWNIY
jgi:hypothetical protein